VVKKGEVTGGEMGKELKVGDKAPAIVLEDQHGKQVSWKDFAGQKVLVYFYPKADTPGCTTQSCAVSESLAALKEAGVKAVGVSPDGPAAQRKFDEKYKLGFPLLADTEHAVAEAYGVWGEKSMYGKKYMGIIRSAFLIDEKGILLAVAYKVSPAETVPFVWQALGV
jgi:thioredoxin-dependent peroxiredoxin